MKARQQNNILTNPNNDVLNVLFAVVVKKGNRRVPVFSLDREGKLRQIDISSKDIAGKGEACTIDGNCRGQRRECKSSDEGDGTEEEHFSLIKKKKKCGLVYGVREKETTEVVE